MKWIVEGETELVGLKLRDEIEGTRVEEMKKIWEKC